MEKQQGIGRIYRKSWCYQNLFGSLRHELDAAQRGIWNDFLDMAKLSRVRPGLIAAAEGVPYKHEWLAAFLNVPLDLLNEAIKVLTDSERIVENNNGIEILNRSKYQTEYDRQKPYRQGNKGGKSSKECPKCGLKIVTSDEYCPDCGDIKLGPDYTAGPYGKYVQR